MELKRLDFEIPKLTFNNFVFPNVGDDNVKKSSSKQELLDKMLKEEKKLQKLKEAGKTDVLKNRVVSKGFENAFKKLQGVKVKDHYGLLARSVEKKVKKKGKSKAKWEEILKNQEKNKLTRKERREANIQAARQKSLQKRINKRNNIKPKKKKNPKKGSAKK